MFLKTLFGMKSKFLLIGLLFTAVSAFAQSNSFLTLKEKFRGEENVFAIGAGRFWIKTALLFIDEKDLRYHFRDVRHVRMITIPQKAFREKNLKLSGFKKILAKDDFEEVASVKERGTHVEIYMKSFDRNENAYFILIDERSEVTALEIIGNIDPKGIVNDYRKNRFTNL
jgi:hypothetical protein